jgi:hypothetical protein
MAYTDNQTFDYSPNSGAPQDQGTTYQDSKYGTTADRDVGVGELGVGSLWKRAVSDQILTYMPWEFSFDTMVNVFGSTDTAEHGMPYEWIERDLFLDYEGAGNASPTDASDVINNTDAGASNTYTPQSEAKYELASGDGALFRVHDTVRYEIANGYQEATVTAISGDELTLASLDGSNLAVADADDAPIQMMGTNTPQDDDYDPQPRQSDPDTYYTYVENPRREVKVTRNLENLVNNGAAFVDFVLHYREQNSANFRRDREVKSLTGSGTKSKRQLSSGDYQLFASGAYNQVKSLNQHTSDFKTSGSFDRDKFKDAINNFVTINFEGESGGPQERMLFVDGTMANYFDRAWDDIQRFNGNEFIAGVSVRRFEQTGKAMDITTVKSWSEVHPLKSGGIRNAGTDYGVGLLTPMQSDYITRVYEEGFSPMEDIFRRQGGDRNYFYRLESKEGVAVKQPQFSSTIEEVDEP